MNRLNYCPLILVLGLVAGCDKTTPSDQQTTAEVFGSEAAHELPTIHPHIWPKQSSPIERDDQTEHKVAALLAKMTLEEKVGQVIQADIDSVTPEDVKQYNLGSIFNGGNSAPGGDNRTPPDAWLALADQFWLASVDSSDGGLGIPTLWGTDAVHGHNNVVGATIFPHNIGLGATRDPSLMFDIGQATAKEMLVTGLDWTFAPTIAVVRDDRWGRTYESYGEAPEIVASYTGKLVQGLQGKPNTDSFLDEDHMIATAKHFIGDGGTVGGIDQGDNQSSEQELRDIQGAGYPIAIANGAQVVMASFNSWHGRKMHGHKELLSDVLVDQMGLDGFVVGDWNGHGQVAGCTNESCAAAFNNGLDMFMAPDSWKPLYKNTLQQVRSGEISMPRLDQAVSRILRVKFRAGLFDAGLPSSRKYSGKYELLASEEHREIARTAVRKSLVMLKNNDQLLPLSPSLNILVAGDGADNIGKQSGGWTLSWQGTGNRNDHFPNGTSIYAGIAQQVRAAGGTTQLSENGEYQVKPDVALVVFGEDPYAEFQGDVAHLDLATESGLELLKKFQEEGIATVAIFISGRPMWVNPEINAADAFVAVWLPGSEGGGIADVLLRQADGSIQQDLAGTLSFSWPKTAMQTTLNVGDQDYDPLFAYGYGLTYADDGNLSVLSENSQLDESAKSAAGKFLSSGDPVAPWRLVLRDRGGAAQVTASRATSATGALQVRALDRDAQEDSSLFVWNQPALMSIEGDAVDLSSEPYTNDTYNSMALEIEYSVAGEMPGKTVFTMGCGEGCAGTLDVTDMLRQHLNLGWQTMQLKLDCFVEAGADMRSVDRPLVVDASGPLSLQISNIQLVVDQGEAGCAL